MDSEILNEKKRDREDKPEALAFSLLISKNKKRKMKEKDVEAEQQNQHPSEVVATPISAEANLPDPKETPKKKKMKKKKSTLNGEQQELNKKEDEKGEVPNETNTQVFPPKPSLVIEVPTHLEMKTESLSHGQSQSSLAEAEEQNQHPSQVCPQPLVVPISVEANLPGPKETPKKKKMKKKKSNLNGEQQELNKKEDEKGEVPNETNAQVFPPEPSLVIEVPTDLEMKTESLSHGQSQSSLVEAEGQNQHPSQVCPQPLVVPISVEANLPDPKETPKKMKKNKSNLNGEQQELNKKEDEKGEVPNETNAQVFPPEPSLAIEVPTDLEMKTESLSHGQSQSNHAEAEGQNQHPSQVCPQPLVVPISIEANLPDPKDTPKKKRKQKKKKKDKSYLNGEQQELNKVEVPNDTNPPKPSLAFEVPADLEMKTEALNHDQDQTKPHTPILVSPIPQTSTLQPTIPIDTEQKMSKSKRKNMKKKMRTMLVQSNKHNIETLAQSRMSICHTRTPTINHTMDPHPAIPTFPKQCSPIEQTISVIDPPLKIYPEPTPLIGQTIPVDPSISMDTEHKLTGSKRKRMNKKMKRMLAGAQPNGNNIKQPETVAQSRTSICHTIPYKPIDGHNQSSKLCWACRRSDHKISQCRMLKSLSTDEEICFFCGEIGHSLGRCSVSLAGGGRFAKCLLCHAYGHFSYNCPGDGHRSYLKVVAANGPIN